MMRDCYSLHQVTMIAAAPEGTPPRRISKGIQKKLLARRA